MKLVRAIWAALFVAATARGQEVNARYELALRLRQLDQAWLETSSWSKEARDARRELALPFIESAAEKFATGDPKGAAKALDDARNKLVGEGFAYWYDALSVTPRLRLCDASQGALSFEIAHFYRPENMQDIVFTGGIVGKAKMRLNEELDTFATEPPWSSEMLLLGLPTGDHQVWTSLFNGDFVEAKRTMTISIVDKRDERLAALEQAIVALPETAPELERETAKALLARLKLLATGSTEDTDYPAARLLGECEQVVAAAAKGERWYGATHAGEFWLALPHDRSASRVRVFVPSGLKPDAPVPLVVALHAGGSSCGSENSFFDSYGAGATKRMCEERGWMLVAPRLSEFGSPEPRVIFDAIAERYPVDTRRVLLISLNGGRVLGAVQDEPARFQTFAALGNDRAVKEAAELGSVQLFLGLCDRDSERRRTEKLHASLVAAGSQRATLKIYPMSARMMVVVDALPDVFRFFDEALAK